MPKEASGAGHHLLNLTKSTGASRWTIFKHQTYLMIHKMEANKESMYISKKFTELMESQSKTKAKKQALALLAMYLDGELIKQEIEVAGMRKTVLFSHRSKFAVDE